MYSSEQLILFRGSQPSTYGFNPSGVRLEHQHLPPSVLPKPPLLPLLSPPSSERRLDQ